MMSTVWRAPVWLVAALLPAVPLAAQSSAPAGQAACEVVRTEDVSDAGVEDLGYRLAELSCPGGTVTAHVLPIPCGLEDGDRVIAHGVEGGDAFVVGTLEPDAATRCEFPYYRLAVEDACPDTSELEQTCKSRSSYDRVPCTRCGWLERHSCDGALDESTEPTCRECESRDFSTVVRGPDSGWGRGVPWETVVNRKYVDRCGLSAVDPLGDGAPHPPLAPIIDALRQAFERYTAADHAAGPAALQQEIEDAGLTVFDYRRGLAVLKEAGWPVAFIRNEMAEAEADLDGNERSRGKAERILEAWGEWTTPEQLELFAEQPSGLAKVKAAITMQASMDPAALAKMPPELRERFSAVGKLSSQLPSEPSPDGPTAENARLLWDNWDTYGPMVELLLVGW